MILFLGSILVWCLNKCILIIKCIAIAVYYVKQLINVIKCKLNGYVFYLPMTQA